MAWVQASPASTTARDCSSAAPTTSMWRPATERPQSAFFASLSDRATVREVRAGGHMAGTEAVVVPSTVLVVDDESAVLQLLTAALTAKHLSVKTAATGEEAIQAMAREPFGCLLVDKNLPGMDGVEVLRRA